MMIGSKVSSWMEGGMEDCMYGRFLDLWVEASGIRKNQIKIMQRRKVQKMLQSFLEARLVKIGLVGIEYYTPVKN